MKSIKSFFCSNKKLSRDSIIATGTALILSLAVGCASSNSNAKNSAKNAQTNLPKVDMTRWQYNEQDDVYYQIGISYVENPVDQVASSYETLGIFVPGAYFSSTQNEDGTFSVTIAKNAKVNGYTANTAPVVIPVETPGYSAMAAPSEYSSEVAPYTKAGFVYLFAGCRGRDQGAPSAIVDLKAAIRYFRFNSDILPGNAEAIFSFGMSGGGAQSALLGATGDSELYEPYLKQIGAVSGVSDAIMGSMDWCPITNLDVANEAYEWNMGQTRAGLSDFQADLSKALAENFAQKVNSMNLKDDSGKILKLEQSDDGYYQAGSYYEWIKSEIERSLNNFLKDTEFPFDTNSQNAQGGFGPPRGMGGRGPQGMPMGNPPQGLPPMGEMDFTQMDNIQRTQNTQGVNISGVYQNVQEYIAALNANDEWVLYDEKTNTARITSIADFAKAVKPASKNIGAFDDLNKSQGENTLFGYNEGVGVHWDQAMANLLVGTEYEEAFTSDLERTDSLGNSVQTRINMYTPLYYLLESSEGYNTSKPAKYWRIRSGIFQGDTSVSTEASLAQALKNYGIKNVDFEMVWGLKHVMAERKGSSTQNFIEWVESCTK